METPHEFLFQNIPGNLKSTSLLINWPLGISKCSLFKLKILARYVLNLFPVWIFPWIAQYSVILRQNTWTYPEVMYIGIWVKALSYSWGSISGKVKSWILFSVWTWHISYLGIRYNIFILYNDSIILQKNVTNPICTAFFSLLLGSQPRPAFFAFLLLWKDTLGKRLAYIHT